MQHKTILVGSLAMLLMATTATQANDARLPVDRLDGVLERVSVFGDQHYREIKVKDRDSVEVGGWLDDQWQATVRLVLASGDARVDELTRSEPGVRGMSKADMRLAMEAAVVEGMVEFAELQVERDGRIEVDGYDADGRELEVKSHQGEREVVEVEYD